MSEIFSRVASACAQAAGSPWAFILSVLVVAAWGVTGPIFSYSDTWQLLINTSTTVVTFWLVFIIQNTQSRDTKAIQAKLDELISATDGARNRMMRIEDTDDSRIEAERKDPTREEAK